MIRENPRCLLPKRHLTPNCASLRNENCVKYIKHLSGSLETQTTTVVSFFFTFPQKMACVMIRYHQMPKLCSWKVSLILIPVEEQREWICTSKKILWWGKRVGALRAIRDKVDSENQKNIVSSGALISWNWSSLPFPLWLWFWKRQYRAIFWCLWTQTNKMIS